MQKIADVISMHSRLSEQLTCLRTPGCGAGGCLFSEWEVAQLNASHAVNDFRKIADIEAYAPTDNVAELTARTDEAKVGQRFSKPGWRAAGCGPRTPLLVFSALVAATWRRT